MTLRPIPGIARNMQWNLGPLGQLLLDVEPFAQGGGDQNGSAATVPLLGRAGTQCTNLSSPRTPSSSGNYCGTIYGRG